LNQLNLVEEHSQAYGSDLKHEALRVFHLGDNAMKPKKLRKSMKQGGSA
jgi:hypothetical protein